MKEETRVLVREASCSHPHCSFPAFEKEGFWHSFVVNLQGWWGILQYEAEVLEEVWRCLFKNKKAKDSDAD